MTLKKGIRMHGPMWQYECTRCRYMAEDIYHTKALAVQSSRDHDCLRDDMTFSLDYDGDEDGVLYATHRPTLQQYRLTPVGSGDG